MQQFATDSLPESKIQDIKSSTICGRTCALTPSVSARVNSAQIADTCYDLLSLEQVLRLRVSL